MEIKQITRYAWQGKEYDSLKAVKDAVHNKIGEEVLDKINRVCPPEQHKNLFKMLEVLCSPEVRKVLKECYSAVYTETDEDGQEYIHNILDLK